MSCRGEASYYFSMQTLIKLTWVKNHSDFQENKMLSFVLLYIVSEESFILCIIAFLSIFICKDIFVHMILMKLYFSFNRLFNIIFRL